MRRRVWIANCLGIAALVVLSATFSFLVPLSSEGIVLLFFHTALAGILAILLWQEWNTIVDGTKDYLVCLGFGVVLTLVTIGVGVYIEGVSLQSLLNQDQAAWSALGNLYWLGRRPIGPVIIGISIASLVREASLHSSIGNVTSRSRPTR